MLSEILKPIGLGLNYYIRTMSTREITKRVFYSLLGGMGRLYILRDVADDEGNYTPSLYTKSLYKFEPTPVEIEKGLVNFERAMKVRGNVSLVTTRTYSCA